MFHLNIILKTVISKNILWTNQHYLNDESKEYVFEYNIHFRCSDSLYNNKETYDEFICPITLNLINHPIMASDGHLYEMSALYDLFVHKDNNPRSPITRELLFPITGKIGIISVSNIQTS